MTQASLINLPILGALSLVGLGLLGNCKAIASPISVNSAYMFLDNVGSNDLGFTQGDLISIGAVATPNGTSGTTVTAQTTYISTGSATVPINIKSASTTASPNEFRVNIGFLSDLAGPWTLTFTNGLNTALALTPSAVSSPSAPGAYGVTVSGSGLNPTFSWNYPSSIDGVTVLIYDKSVLVNGSADLVYAHSMPGSTNSYTLPTVLGGGVTLHPGKPYVVALKGLILRNPLGTFTNQNTASQSVSYFDFTPLTTGVPVYLPTVGTGSGFSYSMTVVAGTEYFIDPSIAIGYEYEIGLGDPNFASVLLPNIQAADFDLSYLVGGSWLSTMVAPGGTFEFPSNGVSHFTVTGIDPALKLAPGNTTAFVTGLTFTGDGSFTGTQVPIIENVPEPNSLALWSVGVAGLVIGRRRRAETHSRKIYNQWHVACNRPHSGVLATAPSHG